MLTEFLIFFHPADTLPCICTVHVIVVSSHVPPLHIHGLYMQGKHFDLLAKHVNTNNGYKTRNWMDVLWIIFGVFFPLIIPLLTL